MPGLSRRVGFFTPIDYNDYRLNKEKPERANMVHAVDDYFYFGGRRAVVIERKETNAVAVFELEGQRPDFILNALKVASYFTFIIPVIMLVIKAVLRAQECYEKVDEEELKQLPEFAKFRAETLKWITPSGSYHASTPFFSDYGYSEGAKMRVGFATRLDECGSFFKRDKGVVLAHIAAQDPSCTYKNLEAIDEKLKRDPDVMASVLQKNGKELELADAATKKDKKYVKMAVLSSSRALEFADEALRKDPEFILDLLSAAKKSDLRYLINFIDGDLRNDARFMLKAIKETGEGISLMEYTNDFLRDNENFILEAVKVDGRALRFASERLKKDRDFVAKATALSSSALFFSDYSLHVYDYQFGLSDQLSRIDWLDEGISYSVIIRMGQTTTTTITFKDIEWLLGILVRNPKILEGFGGGNGEAEYRDPFRVIKAKQLQAELMFFLEHYVDPKVFTKYLPQHYNLSDRSLLLTAIKQHIPSLYEKIVSEKASERLEIPKREPYNIHFRFLEGV